MKLPILVLCLAVILLHLHRLQHKGMFQNKIENVILNMNEVLQSHTTL